MQDNAPYDHNVATLPDKHTQNARNYANEKEVIERLKVIAFDTQSGKFTDVVDARWYMGRSNSASVVYCSVWIHTKDGWNFSGRGSAGGGGYDKISAAFNDALVSAGIALKKPCDGCGEGPMKIAALAVADACGFENMPKHIVN